jgi:hypothetical protein
MGFPVRAAVFLDTGVVGFGGHALCSSVEMGGLRKLVLPFLFALQQITSAPYPIEVFFRSDQGMSGL